MSKRVCTCVRVVACARRCAADDFQQKLLRRILGLIQDIRKALAAHAHRDRPKMPVAKDKRPAMRFNPGAQTFNPGAPTFMPNGGYEMGMGPQMMMAHHHCVPMHGQPGYFPGMANLVMVGGPQMDSSVADYSGKMPRLHSTDADSTASDSSDWSAQSTTASDLSDHANARLSAGARTAQMLQHQAQADANSTEKPRGRRPRTRSNPDMSLSHMEELEIDEDDDGFYDGDLSVEIDGPGHDDASGENASKKTDGDPATPGNGHAARSPAAADGEARAKGAALLSLVADTSEGGSGQISPGAVSVSSTSSTGSTGSRSKVCTPRSALRCSRQITYEICSHVLICCCYASQQHRRAATMDERQLIGQVAAAANLPMQNLQKLS